MNKRRKGSRKVVLAKLLLLIIFFLVLVSPIYKFITDSKWDGKSRYTVVVFTKESEGAPILVYSVEPRQKRASLVSVPSNTLLDVPFGYGQYRASSVFRLGDLDPKRSGGLILTKSIGRSLGVLVDGYVVFEDFDRLSRIFSSKDIQDVKHKYFSFSINMRFTLSAFSKKKITDLALFDQIKLYLATSLLRSDQIKLYTLDDGQILSKQTLPNDQEVLVLNKQILDSRLEGAFEDKNIRKESIAVELVNAAGGQGIASEFERVISSMGGNVVFKTSSEATYKQSCKIEVISKEAGSSMLVERVESAFGCQSELKNSDRSNQSDIRIILGEGIES